MEKKNILLIIIAAIILVILIILFSWCPRMHLSSNTYSKIQTEDKILVLTFDDGPGKETNEILDVLAEKNVSATFFLVGERLEWYENETRRILLEGQEIGSHGYAHKFALFGGKKDYVEGKEFIEEKINKKEKYYRPPYGFRTIKLTKTVRKSNSKIILWDIMPKDFLGWDAERISTYVLKKIKPGSIITLHDGPEGREETVKALAIIIDEARAEGYEFLSLDEALEGREDS